MQEAISWIEDGGKVAIYCEAIHSVDEPLDARKAHRKRRSFPVTCGSSPLYVTAILVAVISGACKNLGEDMRCRIYDRRPLVCRIYPAEISPFIELDPATKVCPTEAWLPESAADNPFAKLLPVLAERSRQTDYNEALRKGLLCADLSIDTTALADEGYIRHIPEPGMLLTALKRAYAADPQPHLDHGNWNLYSPSLQKPGLQIISEKPAGADYSFLRF
jgi:hypothetical protein